MRQVIFSRMWPAGDRWSVSGDACWHLLVIGASPALRGVAGAQPRHSGLGAKCSPVRLHHRLGLSRLSNSLARDALSRFGGHCLDCHSTALPCLPSLARHRVTLALHARNAKKNLSRKRSLQSTIVFDSACNACQRGSIFSEIASVSYAVDSSIDRMMFSRNRTQDFPYRPTFAGVLANVRARSQSTQLRAGHLGTP